ncbi:MAG: DUF559 domain-containing protein [Candidatus Magasanikbacteria bacterium]
MLSNLTLPGIIAEQDTVALVGIVPRPNLWPRICRENWYHVPVAHTPEGALEAHWVAFYFPHDFDVSLRDRISHYARVRAVEVAKRITLFPDEPEHERAEQMYLKFLLDDIRTLTKTIPCPRRVIHILTTLGRLRDADNVNDLFLLSTLEEHMYSEFRRRGISADRQYYVKATEGTSYFLDLCVLCQRGHIDIECDGEAYHMGLEAQQNDRRRDSLLLRLGWIILRFSGREIDRDLAGCVNLVEKTIKALGGIV